MIKSKRMSWVGQVAGKGATGCMKDFGGEARRRTATRKI
jgi:hypothetical protein